MKSTCRQVTQWVLPFYEAGSCDNCFESLHAEWWQDQPSYLVNFEMRHSNSFSARSSSSRGPNWRTSMADANLTGICTSLKCRSGFDVSMYFKRVLSHLAIQVPLDIQKSLAIWGRRFAAWCVDSTKLLRFIIDIPSQQKLLGIFIGLSQEKATRTCMIDPMYP